MVTINRIVKGSEELFFKYGLRSVTMDDIAKHLGMSKKTIYKSFEDKDSIIHALMVQKLSEDEHDIVCLSQGTNNVIEVVFKLMSHMNQMFTKINPNVFYELQKYYPNSWKLFKEFKENCILRMVEETLKRGMKEGHIREDINYKVIARLRLEEVEMGFNPIVFPPDKFKIADVQVALIEHWLYGICTLKGHKLVNKYKQIIEEE